MLSVIIPVKNDARRLARCLASIAASQPAGGREIIVVDNGSTDDSVAVAHAAGAQVLSLPHQRVSALRNEAAAAARGDWLAFVDADHELGASWMAAAIELTWPADVGAAGALYIAPADGTWVQRTYGALRGRTVGRSETRWLGTGNLIVRRDVFAAIGGFDASLDTCEDVDFCQRLRAAGWRLVADERLVSIHHGDPSTLRRLFRAERWRGRDNLRVTFRTQLTARDVPSIVSPILLLMAVPVTIIAAALAQITGGRSLTVAAGAAAAVAFLIAARTIRILQSGGDWAPAALVQSLAVAFTYELARASALVTRAGHHRDSSTAPPRPAGAATVK